MPVERAEKRELRTEDQEPRAKKRGIISCAAKMCHTKASWRRQGQHVARTRCSGPSAKVPAVMQENTTKKIQHKNAGNTENGLAALQLLPATLVRNERINAAFKIYDIYSARQRGQ